MRRRLIGFVAVAMAVAACGGGVDSLTVSDQRIGEPTGPNAAMYFTVESNSADRLLEASTAVAASVQIHETVMDDHGAMGMHALDSLDVPADTEVVLEPGGTHLMLIDVDRLRVGESVEVVLTWENAGEMKLDVEVVEAADTMGDDGRDG
ncbi:MAG: copper chaperone PCu(A)C [Acidimicrobiia bacterium]